MRARGLSLSLLALLVGFSSNGFAQTKKPATKPKVEEPKLEPEPEPKPAPPPPSDDPPKIDTNLREAEPSSPQSNPWGASGLVKKRDGRPVNTEGPTGTSESERSRPRPEEPGPIAVALMGGYASENLNVGLGVRGGYTFYNIYVGAQFMFHLGQSEGESSVRFFYPSLELGYDFRVSGVTFRPYSGIGYGLFKVSSPLLDATTEAIAFYPGMQIDFMIPNTPGFVGIDGRGLLLFGTDSLSAGTSFAGYLVGGARF